LWIIAMHHYLKSSGDTAFIAANEKKLEDAARFCANSLREDGFVYCDNKATWMDTTDRRVPIDIQTFVVAALRDAGQIFKTLGRKDGFAKEMIQKADATERKLNKEFWDESGKFFKDSLDQNKLVKTINPMFTQFFELAEKDITKVLESEEFTTPFGIRSVANTETVYNPAGYHSGSSWGWLVGMMACLECKQKNPDRAIEYLDKLYQRLSIGCVCGLDETWNAETGSSLLLKNNFWEECACLQGFSSALAIRCLDEYMLGLNVDALNKSIILSPSIPKGAVMSRRKMVGNDLIDISIKRIDDRIKLNVSGKNKDEYRIILVP
jgi:glycogen debranching enzyme